MRWVFGQRLVLDELHQRILVDNLAWRGRQISPDDESLFVVGRNVEPPLAALQVIEQVLETVQHALALGFDEPFAGGRIQKQEVARRQRAEELPGVERRLQMILRSLRQGLEKLVGGVLYGEMRIAQTASDRIIAPGRVTKASVGSTGGAFATPGIAPGFHRVEPRRLLEGGKLYRILGEFCEDLHDRCAG